MKFFEVIQVVTLFGHPEDLEVTCLQPLKKRHVNSPSPKNRSRRIARYHFVLVGYFIARLENRVNACI